MCKSQDQWQEETKRRSNSRFWSTVLWRNADVVHYWVKPDVFKNWVKSGQLASPCTIKIARICEIIRSTLLMITQKLAKTACRNENTLVSLRSRCLQAPLLCWILEDGTSQLQLKNANINCEINLYLLQIFIYVVLGKFLFVINIWIGICW